MRKFLCGLIACIFIITPAVAENLSYRDNKERYDLWIEACLYTQYSCLRLDPPKIQYKSARRSLYGWYDGGDTIYINSKHRVSTADRRATIYHEMVHYLQVYDGYAVVPGYAKDICKMEEEAFAETDERWDRINMGWKKRGPNWWRSYKHCRRFYAPNYVEERRWWW